MEWDGIFSEAREERTGRNPEHWLRSLNGGIWQNHCAKRQPWCRGDPTRMAAEMILSLVSPHWFCVYVWLCMYMNMHMLWPTCGGQRTTCGDQLSSPHVDPGDQTQLVRLGGKHPNLLSHLISYREVWSFLSRITCLRHLVTEKNVSLSSALFV